MNIRYRVELSEAERSELGSLLRGGQHAARKLKRAQILLAADAGVADETIAQSLGVGGSTVYRTKRHFVEGTLGQALHEEPRPGAKRKLTGLFWLRPRAPARPRAALAGPSNCSARWCASPSTIASRAKPCAGASQGAARCHCRVSTPADADPPPVRNRLSGGAVALLSLGLAHGPDRVATHYLSDKRDRMLQ